jgi:drug/metabolite transporter (DMT)-like permease
MATRVLHLPVFAVSLAVCVALGWGLAELSGMPLWASITIVTVAVLANGFLATVEDCSPGGFENPDGTATPRWLIVFGAITKWAGIGLLLLMSAFFAALFDNAPKPATATSAPLLIAMVTAPLLMALWFFNRNRFRWSAWVAAALIVLGILVNVLAE